MTYPDDLPPEERRSIALQEMHRYGREDFIFSRLPPHTAIGSVYADGAWNVSLLDLEDAYKTGWQEAEQEYQRDGATLFYLHELLERLRTDRANWIEWYGTSFDEPLELTRKAIVWLTGKWEV